MFSARNLKPSKKFRNSAEGGFYPSMIRDRHGRSGAGDACCLKTASFFHYTGLFEPCNNIADEIL